MEMQAWLEGVGRVDNISNLCFSDEDRLESSVADSTLNQLSAREIKGENSNNNEIVLHALQEYLQKVHGREKENR